MTMLHHLIVYLSMFAYLIGKHKADEIEELEMTTESILHDYFKVDAEKFKTESKEIIGSGKTLNQTERKSNHLMSVMRNLLKKEVRKLKSTITDSIMEEVINYYGKKLELTDVLKENVDDLNKKIHFLTDNFDNLNQNYKNLVKNHRNLVDMVRNNLLSAKKEKEAKVKFISNSKAGMKNGTNTRALIENIKKTSKLQTSSKKLLANQAHFDPDTNMNSTPNEIVMKLKLELMNDFETKYSHLINEKLENAILKNLNDSSTSSNNYDSRNFLRKHDENENQTKEINFPKEKLDPEKLDPEKLELVSENIFQAFNESNYNNNDPIVNIFIEPSANHSNTDYKDSEQINSTPTGKIIKLRNEIRYRKYSDNDTGILIETIQLYPLFLAFLGWVWVPCPKPSPRPKDKHFGFLNQTHKFLDQFIFF